MRRALEVLVLISTTVILIATSRAPDHCVAETVVLHAQTTCAPDSDVTFTSTTACTLTASGGGFPTSGNVVDVTPDAGVRAGFELFGPRFDGGVAYTCSAVPEDGGLFVSCSQSARCGGDAGPCAPECEGFLTNP